MTTGLAIAARFEIPALHLGPITLHAFGALVALAVLVGTWVLRRRAQAEHLDPELAGRMVMWCSWVASSAHTWWIG